MASFLPVNNRCWFGDRVSCDEGQELLVFVCEGNSGRKGEHFQPNHCGAGVHKFAGQWVVLQKKDKKDLTNAIKEILHI